MKRCGTYRWLFIVFALLVQASPAWAADSLLDGARRCTRYFPRYEQHFQLPVHLLTAVAVTESGRWHKGIGHTVPWPWTIHTGGKGYYFNSIEEAVAATHRLVRKGVTNIDIGCMQVNYRYHGHYFPSIAHMFDPRYNVAYAAKFLSDNYDETRTWMKAIAIYHSRTPSRGRAYARKVMGAWKDELAQLETVRDRIEQEQPEEKVSSLKGARRESDILVYSGSRSNDVLHGGN